ncbi:MAG TPA: hypothetical protein VLT36_02275 [Candidatus Dormibacteraeota bacterium]|nr:hypothetical protein [Candidatus Dormibacteraeota bacterium]
MKVSLMILAACLQSTLAAPSLRTEHFDHDPGWEGLNNHFQPTKTKTVHQDFGYCAPSAADTNGAIGGTVTRASKPAYYAATIANATLNTKLSASGAFRLKHSSGSSGIFFGFFNDKQPGGGGRPVNSLGMDFDGERSGARLAVRMINGQNKSCGTFITPFIPGKFRPTPIRNDGTLYRWKLDYDPDAAGGKGQFRFVLKRDGGKPEEFEGKTFSVDLPAGFKAEGAVFNRFGLMNMMKAGGTMRIYFSELSINQQKVGLATEPGWVGSGNRDSYEEHDQAGAHDFGFSPTTSFAGGTPGEIGGKFWRSGSYGYYAGRIGALALTDHLEASSRVVLLVGAPDSDMYFGWFNSGSTNQSPVLNGNFLGVHIGGPTRIGHYFQPAYTTARGNRGGSQQGPILSPNKVFQWTLKYDPDAHSGDGEIEVRLGDETIKAPLRPGRKVEGAKFDRFGLFTSTIGGQMVQVYFDDLTYSTGH